MLKGGFILLLDFRTRKMIVWLIGGTFLVLILILMVFKLNTDNPEGEMSDLDKVIPYGDFLSWNEVNKLFPKNACATVIDFDTGMQFQVQRRGGYNHVDVQPLTADDTAIMKGIYEGKWGWKRKAVIVQLKSRQRVAASMNGMPHGQGAIEGNNFDGHFCIHFRDSKTHGSKKVDLAHQMMIWKAANVMDQQLEALSPDETIAVFFTAVDQHEFNIARKLIYSYTDVDPLLKGIESIENIKADNIRNTSENSFTVNIRVVFNDSNREFRKNIVINTIAQKAYWQIDANSLNQLMDKKSWSSIQTISNSPMEEEDWEIGIN
jgi:hypothetical protein